MGDVLPPKRTVVERLRLRLERYRWHHNSCLPRYEQSANSLCDKQRQDTVRLKQRFLESKAKKSKSNKSDHHRVPVAVRESTPDAQKLVPHSKINKVVAEGSPANPTIDPPTTEDVERPAKSTQPDNAPSESLSTSEQPHPSTPKFSLPVVQQFASCNPTVQTGGAIPESSLQQQIPASQNQALLPKQQATNVPSQGRTSHIESSSSVKCKQEEEKPVDVCHFKTPPPSSDRLSDTFPSIGFAEDSGDNVIHPDLLKDLIDDVFTNSGDIQDFDFEDSVCSMKDDEKDDIDELVKATPPVPQMQPFHSSNMMFNSHPISQAHQSGSLFGAPCITTSSTLAPVSSAAPSSTTSSLYGSHQRMSTYSAANNLNLANGLGLDFKLTEPSPAALTLKQMAEQHQNMQQKQQQLNVNLNSFNLRNQFDLDSFSDPMSTFNARYLNRPVQRSQSSSVFQSMAYDPSFPGVVPLSANDLFKQEPFNIRSAGPLVNPENQKHLLQIIRPTEKQQSCGTDRTGFYQDNVLQSNPGQHAATTQYLGNITSDVQLHMDQTQQISPANNGRPMPVRSASHDIKQTDASQPSFSNMYSYNSQPGNERMYQLPMNQNAPFTAQYNIQSSNHPPPEYKISQTGIRPNNVALNQSQLQPSPPYHRQLMTHQRPINVSTNQWRTVHQSNHAGTDLFQHQESYGNLNCTGAIPSNIHHSPMHHPYRTVGDVGQMTSNRLSGPVVSSSNSALQQHPQQQQVTLHHQQQHSMNPALPNININMGTSSATHLYSSVQDLNTRQDNSQISLDFLDHIQSSAPELLNFDNVIQNSDTTHFQLLDDMEMLGK